MRTWYRKDPLLDLEKTHYLHKPNPESQVLSTLERTPKCALWSFAPWKWQSLSIRSCSCYHSLKRTMSAALVGGRTWWSYPRWCWEKAFISLVARRIQGSILPSSCCACWLRVQRAYECRCQPWFLTILSVLSVLFLPFFYLCLFALFHRASSIYRDLKVYSRRTSRSL